MRIGSLFSGIGGLELGLERSGLGPVVWQVEIDPFCRDVLAMRWPEARRYEDVRTVGARNLEPVDLICGGFPCQDLSHAGARAGIDGERSGLWRQYLRVVGELRPRFVLAENVFQAWRSWVPFVRRDLWGLGYASVPLRLSAAEVGADHKRARGFVLAHADGQLLRDFAEWFQGSGCGGSLRGRGEAEPLDARWGTAVARVARVDDGLPAGLDEARAAAVVPFWGDGECRRKALGNAVVPQVAEVLGRGIVYAERRHAA